MIVQRRGALGRLRSSLLAALTVIAVATLAAAPRPAEAQSFTFSGVRIEGNQRIEDEAILTLLGIARGETVSAGELNDAVQRIRNSGLFEDVSVTPQGGTLVIVVDEYPTIARINFEGNARITDDQLAQIVRSQSRRVYSPNTAEQDTAAIVQAYTEQGRVNAIVTPRIIPRSDNRVDLVFEIQEGGLSEIARVSFVGNRAYSERRLRGVIATKQAGLLSPIIQSDTFVASRIDQDREALTDFYRSRGYVDFQVLDVDVGLTAERDAYLITFTVQEGQRYRIGNVSMTSEIPGVPADRFRDVIRLSGGEVYSPVNIDNDIERVERAATRAGIDFLTVEPRITRTERNLLLNVQYVLVRGERLFVERIDIEGNNTTLDRVIRSQFRTVEGDPFNPREIRQAANRIRRLGYFAAVDVNTREGSASDQIVVDVNVTEQPTGSLSFGANYSTDNGFGLLASFRERNFLGRGQDVYFQISTSQQNQVYSFDFTEPQFLGRDLSFGLEAAYRTTDRDTALYDTETFRFSPSLGFPVSENGRLSVFVATEYNDITNVAGLDTPSDPTDDASIVIQNEAAQGGAWTQSVGYNYNFDTRRTGLDPNSGIVLRFGQEFGVGDRQFVRTTALAAAETRVWGEELTLRATVEGGHLYYEEGSSRVTDRFFLGSRQMRGFDPGGIGPRDADSDDALGGNAFAVARLEAEFPLGLPEEYGITGGAFIDYGSVWEVGETYGADILYNDFTPRAVAGVSIFWDTPLGPLRFNFTEALQVEEFDNPRSFDLTIATSF